MVALSVKGFVVVSLYHVGPLHGNTEDIDIMHSGN